MFGLCYLWGIWELLNTLQTETNLNQWWLPRNEAILASSRRSPTTCMTSTFFHVRNGDQLEIKDLATGIRDAVQGLLLFLLSSSSSLLLFLLLVPRPNVIASRRAIAALPDSGCWFQPHKHDYALGARLDFLLVARGGMKSLADLSISLPCHQEKKCHLFTEDINWLHSKTILICTNRRERASK